MKLINQNTGQEYEFLRVEHVSGLPVIKVWILKNSKGEEVRMNRESMYLCFGKTV